MDILSDGELVLYGFVGESFWEDGFTASDVVQALAAIGRNEDVTVRLNSYGGIASEGVAIHSALKAHGGRVTVIVDAIAASSASVIAMAGDEVIMRTGSLIMIHDPSMFTVGTAADHRRSGDILDTLGDSYADIYAAKTGKDPASIRADMKAETWLSAEEAVSQGYADRSDSEEASEPVAFNYRVFSRAPERIVALAVERGWSRKGKPAARAVQPPKKDTPAMTTKKTSAAKMRAEENQEEEEKKVETRAEEEVEKDDDDQPEARIVSLDAARKVGHDQALAYVTEVHEICALAGVPEKAVAYLAEKKPASEIRAELMAARANADDATAVRSQHATPSATAQTSWDKAIANVNARIR